MSETLEAFMFTVGDALVAPSVGRAELILALLVALGFLASGVLSLFGTGQRVQSRRERRF